MKSTYLIEYEPAGFFSPANFEILYERSQRLLLKLEKCFGSGDWLVKDPRNGEDYKVATVRDEADWFSNDTKYYIKTHTERVTKARFEDDSSWWGPTVFRLQSDRGWNCKFEYDAGFCSPSEYYVSLQMPNGKGSCTLADVTECCGCKTYGVTFDHFGDEDFRMVFLVGCALVQYHEIRRQNTAAAAAAAS